MGQELGHQGLLGTVAISGLQNRHREYGPARSVFLQRDHLATRNVAAGSFPDGMHLYHYARGNPLRYVDPRGLACGSGLSDFIVPDNIAGRDVTACCQAHDRCYETCGASRMGCDQALAQCIMARCNDPRDCGIVPIFPHMFFNILVRGNCGRGAAVFYSAVRMYGKGAFDAAQEGCTEPPPDECGSECIWSCMGGNPFAPELDVPCYDSCSAGCPGNVNDVQIVNPGW